ncbi:hypothetical protein ACLOJK_026685 [Asimina triloba]
MAAGQQEERLTNSKKKASILSGMCRMQMEIDRKKSGIASLVLERSAELRATSATLTLFPNARRALDALRVAHKLTSIYPAFHAKVSMPSRSSIIDTNP